MAKSKWDRLDDETKREHRLRVDRMLEMADVLRRDRIKPGDPDFAERVGNYMAGEIDPSIAVHNEVDLPENVGLGFAGYRTGDNEESGFKRGRINGKDIEIEMKPNTVGAVHTKNTPTVYGHEYRHKNYPELRERENRHVDLAAAQTDHDVDEAIRMFADARGGGIPSERLSDAAQILRLMERGTPPLADEYNVIAAETGQDPEDVIEASAARKFMDDVRDYEKWNKGVKERNKKRKAGEPETVADTLRKILEDMGL